MQSRLRIAGHGLQPLLLMFPLGLFWMAFVFDLATLLGAPALIGTVAFWNLVAGLGGGLLAALTAGFDAASATGPAARIFVLALLLDAGVLITFAVLTLMRVRDPDRTVNASLLLVELAGLAAAGFGAWFGGRLADPRAPVADPRQHRTAGLRGGRLNTGLANTGVSEAGRLETGLSEVGHWDTGLLDTSPPDTGFLDGGRLNTGLVDTSPLNTGFLDTISPRRRPGGRPEAGRPEAGRSHGPQLTGFRQHLTAAGRSEAGRLRGPEPTGFRQHLTAAGLWKRWTELQQWIRWGDGPEGRVPQVRGGQPSATSVRRGRPDSEKCANQAAHSGTEAMPRAASASARVRQTRRSRRPPSSSLVR
jgi:uncharacterized membrane protein